MASALETLCGQAFGAGQVHMLGVYLQRSWIILISTAIVLSPLYVFANPILRLLGQDEQIAQLASEFTLALLPRMFAMAVNFPTQKFLQAQSKVGVMAWIGLVALIFHVFLLWLFIVFLDWGLGGAAAAVDISNCFIAIAQIVYVVVWCRDAWQGFSWLAFKDIWGFVRLSFASAVMFCLEIWYMMVLVVLAGHLSNAEIAVGAISIW